MVAIAAAALLVTLHLRDVMSEPFDDLMRATNGAHVSVTGPRAAVAEALARPEVAEAGTPRRHVAVAPGDRPLGRIVVSALPAGATVDRPLPTQGRLPRRAGEVAILAPLALAERLRPGDETTLGGVAADRGRRRRVRAPDRRRLGDAGPHRRARRRRRSARAKKTAFAVPSSPPGCACATRRPPQPSPSGSPPAVT